jgi:FKBP-type peptidyl-prolyl cis-trans isomerase FklB
MSLLQALMYYLIGNFNLIKIFMKIKGIIVITGVVALLFGSCSTSSIENSKLVTENDTLSYAIGANFYKQLSKDSIFLNPLVFAKSLMDGKTGKPVLNEAEIQSFLTKFSAKMQETQMKQQQASMKKQAEVDKVTYKDYIEQNEAFLAKNKEKAGVTVTPSGLQYEVITMGKGPKPTTANTVKVHYVGTLIDGTEFDSSIKRKEPAQFPVSGMIPGWTEALQLMPVGSKFKFYLPQSIAYGPSQRGEFIKPYSTLVFEVELLEIVK